MGSGRWSTDVYKRKEKNRKASGKSAFDYSDHARRTGMMKPHDTLDPFGVRYRESRDSDEHPASNSIAVLFDVTGSMLQVPVGLQQALPQLLGLLLYKEYIPHPQILFGAVGDATSDRVPLQVGQYESDNRMDDHLQNMILEGGGGGQKRESYELGMYFIARHTSLDCWEKRRKKGYLFMIGDELAYSHVKKNEVQDIIGGGLERDLPLDEMVRELKEKFHFYFLIPTDASYGNDQEVYQFWHNLLGGSQYVIQLEKAANVAQTIALIIGTQEGTIDLEEGKEHMREMGADEDAVDSVSKALAVLPNTGKIVKGSSGLDDLDDDGSGGTRRL